MPRASRVGSASSAGDGMRVRRHAIAWRFITLTVHTGGPGFGECALLAAGSAAPLHMGGTGSVGTEEDRRQGGEATWIRALAIR